MSQIKYTATSIKDGLATTGRTRPTHLFVQYNMIIKSVIIAQCASAQQSFYWAICILIHFARLQLSDHLNSKSLR